MPAWPRFPSARIRRALETSRRVAGSVVRAHEVAEQAGEPPELSTRVTIGRELTGHLQQSVLRLSAGAETSRSVASDSEEVLFVARGKGSVDVTGGGKHFFHEDVGIYIAPGETYQLRSDADEDTTFVVVNAPVPVEQSVELGERRAIVRVADQPVLPAGKDREFRFVITPESGCRGMTQFVGWIPPGRARDHYHEYDEVAYILSGAAVLHREGAADVDLGPGSCIHFPSGMVHCVENVGEAPVRVLGVFHPPGSAAAAYHHDE